MIHMFYHARHPTILPTSMRSSLLIVPIAVLAVGCSDQGAADKTIPQTVVGVDIESKEPRFVFVGPDGFEWNDEQRIFYNKQIRTSVKLAHSAGSQFQALVDEFVADNMRAAGMELLNKEIRDIEGRPTLLVHANRLTGKYPQQVCTVAFATSDGCAQLTAVYPADMDDDLKDKVETALLAARYEVPN